MLNEEKIKLMTGIAMFEKKADKEIFPVNRYFKGDYISSHLIRSFFAYTLTAILCLLLWGLYSIEDILNTMDPERLLAMVKTLGFYYLAGLLVYLAVTYWVYAKRYDFASKSMKIYLAKLRRLEKKYESQSGPKENEEVRRR